MSKKSGSKSSRSERRAGRQRAERAREHGLPARVAPPRARALTPPPSDDGFGEARSSATPSSRAAKPGIPTLVKVLGGALVILIAVYLLSRQRDEELIGVQPSAEPPARSAILAPVAEPPPRASAPAETAPAPNPATP